MAKNQTIGFQQIVRQGEGNIVSDMDGEKVMLSIHNGKYYNLGEMGGEIWELIKEPTSVQELVKSLIAQYEVAESECYEQVAAFLNLLANEGLIQVKE